MKQHYLKFLLAFCILLMKFSTNAQSIPELLYYKFDGAGGTVPNMASAPPAGTGTATIMGAITQGGSGECGGALIGSGNSASTDYLNTGWATNLTGTSWTISFWSSNITPSATLFYIFGDAGASSFRCFTNGVAGPNNWILRGGMTDVLLTGGATVAPHMNTFVYDITLGDIRAYLDGVLINTVAQAGPTITGAGPFKVMGYASNVGAPVNGLLDEFRVYNHALSPAEIMNLYTSVTASATVTTVCEGGPTTLSATGASNYTWEPGSIPGNNIVVNPLTTTTYTVTGNDAGCAYTSTVTINVTNIPAPSPVTATPALICGNGGNSDLNATSAGNTIHWYTVPSGGINIGTSASGANFNVAQAMTTTYYAEAQSGGPGGSLTFNYTGALQTFTVPAGVTSVTINAKGAQGGSGALGGGGTSLGGNGGLGSSATGVLSVVPGDVLNIYVGGQGIAPNGGFNGGGDGGTANAGGGGGASDIRLNSILPAARVIVGAGGGGGGRGGCETSGVNGGNGGDGDGNGANGTNSPDGGGGFAASGATGGGAGIGCGGFLGGVGNTATTEAGATGGTGQACCCFGAGSIPGGGGGGGGLLGGGGGGGGSAGTVGCSGNNKGGGGGGAGGSSYTGTLTSPVIVTGVQTGNGEVTITWSATGCISTSRTPVTVTVSPIPAVTATATPNVTCNLTSVTPNGGGAATYVWSGGLTDNMPFVATSTATYTVTGTDGAGCTATSTVTVTVNPASGVLAPATSNQSQNHGDDFNINYYDGSCDLIATVDDGAAGNILGLTTSTVNVDATAGTHNGQPFVRRWYQITPTSNGSADVILYINQSDFNDYNAIVAAPYLPLPTSGNNADPNVANIRITKNDDAGLGNNPVVITPTVNWNGTYWELSFNTPSFSQFRVHGMNPGNVPLPATVINFTGTKLESSDKLSWTTASEQNNAYFNLQHSTDGISFRTIAKVNSKAANGNSTSLINYTSVNDKPALGHNYYRLQQIDIDNKVSVHAQIVDLIWGANGSSVSIYPNPTTDILNVDLYTAKSANTTVKLLDMSGRVIKQIQAKSVIGMNNIQLSMGEITSGVYTIEIYENNMLTHTSKVSKNN